MACSRLVGLEKGNCVFLGCFLMSAAGGFVYIYTRTRTRKGFGSVGLSFLFRKLNKGFPLLFRKQNNGRLGYSDKFRKLNTVGMKKPSTGFFSVVGRSLSYLKSGKRSRAVLSMYTHVRARWLRSFSFGLFLSEKTLFSFSFFCKSIILFLLSLS